MKVIIHDLGEEYNEILQRKCDVLIHADGKYAPCQGCFGCWTKHPAQCYMKDSLQTVCRTIGKADELIIVSENYYGGYSPEIKNILDNSELTENALNDDSFTIEETLEMIPQRRFIEPIEIAECALYLASDKAKGITGQYINLCAGLSIG